MSEVVSSLAPLGSSGPTRRIKRGWMNLEVVKVGVETHDTLTFYMVDKEDRARSFDYDAGQYLTFRFDTVAEKPIVRSYTMSSSPCEPDTVAFTVKRVTGGVISNWLCDEIKVGSILRARGPIGKFCYDPNHDKSHLVMVAGGSGVTPFVSILREWAPRIGQSGAPKKMTLLVSYRSREDLICWDALEAVKAQGAKVVTTLTREEAREGFLHGRINDEMIRTVVADADYENTTFMTCGPTEIMAVTAAHCRHAGIAEAHIKQESFE